MASQHFLHFFLLVTLLSTSPHLSLSQSQSPISLPPTSSTFSSSNPIAPSPHFSVSIPPSFSPFASPPTQSPSSDDADADADLIDAPAPSPLSSSVTVSVTVPAPAPVPAPSHLAVKATTFDAGEVEETEKNGLNGGKKAGVVVGVFAATALVGLGVLVCKKRQDNIRRSRYSHTSRVELI